MEKPIAKGQPSIYSSEDINKAISGYFEQNAPRKGGSLISVESLDIKIFTEKLKKSDRKLWGILKMLSEGYRKSEIGRILNLPYRQVQRLVDEIAGKLKAYLGC